MIGLVVLVPLLAVAYTITWAFILDRLSSRLNHHKESSHE